MVRHRYQRTAASEQPQRDAADPWYDYRQFSPASTNSFYEGTWRQRQADVDRGESLEETWVRWCDARRVLRSMIKLGASDPRTAETWIRRPHTPREEAFSVDMCSLLPFDWDLVDTPAPMHFNRSPSDSDVDTSSVGSRSSASSRFERGSYQTSVLSKSPGWSRAPAWMHAQAPEVKPKEPERKFRGGVPPPAPSYDGSRDLQIIKKWKKKVKVWIQLSSPYIPAEEQGLRLWQALKGDGQRRIHERDDDDLYFAENGVEVLIATVEQMFGQDEMVELDDRLDSFFDPAKMTRRPGESVIDIL